MSRDASTSCGKGELFGHSYCSYVARVSLDWCYSTRQATLWSHCSVLVMNFGLEIIEDL